MSSCRICVIVLSVSLIVSGLPVLGQGTGEGSSVLSFLKPALDSVRGDEILTHIKKLASNEFEGRGPATRGEALTVNYLVDQLKRSGLRPGNPDGTFVQKVPMVGFLSQPRIDVESGGKHVPLNFQDDFVHDYPALRSSVSTKKSGVVFAGYGIVAPEYGWDDYKDADVRNKLVIVLSGEPSAPDKRDPSKLDPLVFKGDTRTYYSTRDFKYDLAARKGAAAILVITDPEKSITYSLFQTFAKMEGFALKPRTPTPAFAMAGLITANAARRLFAAAGKDLDKLEGSAGHRDFRPVSTNARAKISVKTKLRSVTSHNVVARIEGSDPRLKAEHVIYTAHWDHLGIDKDLKGDQIFNGALDDAVGTAQLLEVAKGFAKLSKKPNRSILFNATTSEEKGFLGSRYYAENPLYPIAKSVANINLDGGNVWGRTKDVITSGYGLSTIDEYLEGAAKLQGRDFVRESIDNGSLYFGSDQIQFARAGIPAVFPFSGSIYPGRPSDFGDKKWNEYADKDYHQVSDEVKADWDLSGAAEDAQWLLIAGYKIAQAEKRPEWKKGSEFRRRPVN